MMQIFMLLLGLLAPALAVIPLMIRLLSHHPKILACLLCFPVGWAFFTMLLFLINLLFGFKIGLLSGMISLFAIFAVALLVSMSIVPDSGEDNAGDLADGIILQSKATWADVGILSSLVILSLIFWAVLGFLALSSPVDSIPGFGVWGYKSLLIHATGNIPFDAMSGAGRPYLHPDYPLCYPILLAWCHFCMGEFNDHLIKLVPFITGLLSFLLFTSICVRLGTRLNAAILFALLASASGSFVLCATTMYTELLLLVFVLPGLFLISMGMQCKEGLRDIFLGLLLLAMSAWIKSEGLIYFFGSVVLILFFAIARDRNAIFNRRFGLAVLLPVLLFIAPWTACRLIFGFDAVDFDLSKPFSYGIQPCLDGLWLALLRTLKHIFVDIKASGGVWIFISLAVAAALLRRAFDRLTCFLCCFTVMMLISFVGIFFFSVRPLDWHVEALPRLLLVLGTAVLPFAIQNFNKDHNHANA